MLDLRRVGPALWIAAALCVAFPISATPAGAAVTIGQATGSGTQICTTDYTWVQEATTAANLSYVVPAGGGVITAWTHGVSNDTPNGATMRLKIFRKTATQTYLTVGHSAVEALIPGLHVFETRITVQPGDLLGLRTGGTEGTDCYRTGVLGDDAEAGSGPDPPISSAFAPTETSAFVLNIAATLEADADADDFGDETQDECPGVSGSANGCVPTPPDTDPPETTITKGAPNKTEKTKAKFKFSSDEPGATFECKLDTKAFKACTSPKTVKHLDDGKHKFKVRAVDAAGNVDPSAAKDKFKVVG